MLLFQKVFFYRRRLLDPALFGAVSGNFFPGEAAPGRPGVTLRGAGLDSSAGLAGKQDIVDRLGN